MSTTSQTSAATSLQGKVALVTGGSRGIGKAVAAALSARGASVVITGRNRAQLEQSATELSGLVSTEGAVRGVAVDLQEPDGAVRAVDASVVAFGGLDILVNNAGVGLFNPVADMSDDEWRSMLATNLDAVFYCCRAAIPHLRVRGGWIINISSLASKNPFKGGAAYSATKAGLNAFSEALMQEVRDDGIRVSCVMPGSVSTGFGGKGVGGVADWKLQPEDVAEVIVDLIAHPSRSLPSAVELRPSRPPKKSA